jgi:hypothetical protein
MASRSLALNGRLCLYGIVDPLQWLTLSITLPKLVKDSMHSAIYIDEISNSF